MYTCTFSTHCAKVLKRCATNSNGEDDGSDHNDDNDKEKAL